MLNKIFTGLYHFCWYAFAFIILNAAVLVTVVRLALPEIGTYKTEIQSWVSQQMGHPVVITDISAEWQGWTPNLYLGNIDLYTQDNSNIITKLDSAHIGIDLIASIQAVEIIPNHLSVSGLDLGISRHRDGSISISSDDPQSRDSNNTALSGWLLKQKYIILDNASVRWKDETSASKEKQFSNVQIQLRTDKQRLQLETSIGLPEEFGQSLSMKIDVTGNILTPDWSGSVYVAAEEFKPSGLLHAINIKSVGGNGNFKIWTRWEKSKLIDFSGETTYSDFLLSNGNHNLRIDTLALKLFGERQLDSTWLLNAKLDKLKTKNGAWPASTHQLIFTKDSSKKIQYSAYFSYLKLEEVLPFVISANAIPDKFKKAIQYQSVKGALIDLKIAHGTDSKSSDMFQVESGFKDIELVSHDNKNAASGLDGTFSANNEQINVQLKSELPQLKIGFLFDEPHTLSALNAHFEISNNELGIQDLELKFTELSISSSGKIRFEDESPFVDMVVHLDETNIENIPSYLPKQTKPKLRDWFKRALAGGRVLPSDLIFRGYLKDYPFKESEGHLKAIINIADTTLDYNEKWPAIDNFTAEIILNNDNLKVLSHSGYIFNAKINDLTAEIKTLATAKREIDISGRLNGHTSDARNFIVQSPINKNKSVSDLMNNIAGGFNLDLKLNIPLFPKQPKVEGLVSFTDTTIESRLPGLGLEKVNGDVHFTKNKVWASEVDALYYGTPVTLTIPKIEEGAPYSEIFEISGSADKAFIINQLGRFFPSSSNVGAKINDYFNGESKWTVALKKSISENNISSSDVELSSDLNGVQVSLPYPFGKTKLESRPLTISTRLTDVSINKITFNYDDLFYTDVIVDNSNNLLIKNILVGLGQPHSEIEDTSDVSIQGNLDSLNLSEWMSTIAAASADKSPTDSSTQPRHVSGNININQLKILDNNFNNVNVKLANSTEGWNVTFDGNEMKGDTRFIKGIENRPNKLNVDLEKLSLEGHEQEDTSTPPDIDKIPDLVVNIDEFTYKNNQLGKFNLLTQKIENGINISNLAINKPGFSISANGIWNRVDEVDRSEFNLKLESDSVETMLSTFNYNSANIKDGQTTIEMNASWMDTPMNFAMGKVNGDLDMKIEKGQFLDINPSAGRIFGLLSIQTLPRRLALDFTDLFNKGFSFDSISGHFSLDKGHAYTNDLELLGPAANIIVSGRTGFITEDYDQIATITPKFSNSLPVASALFGPIGVGVGAVIYLTGELFKSIPDRIDEILQYQYSIKGRWDNPDIVKLKKDKKSG